MNLEQAALLVIDVQRGFDDPKWGSRNNPSAEDNMGRLIERWRQRGRPLVFVQHHSQEPGSPLRAGQPGHDFKEVARPAEGEPVFGKRVNSAFIGTALEQHLREHDLGSLIIVGLTTDHCVSTTARMAANLGFETAVVADATATFDREGPGGRRFSAEEIHQASLASLNGEFAQIMTTDEILS